MKIVQINTDCNWGSTGRIAEEVGKLVIAEGWESHIAYGRNGLISASHTFKIVNRFNHLRHRLLTRITDKTGFYNTCETKRFVKYLEQIKPDIIHLHNIHGYYINIKLLFEYLAKYNIPVVWTLHDCWTFTGHCAYFDSIGCERWKTQCYACPEKGTYPGSWLMDRSRKNYTDKKLLFNSVSDVTLVPVSQWLGDLVSESFLKNHKLRVIHNGIDLDVFTPTLSSLRSDYGLDGKTVLLGVASIWDKRKGLADFIKLAAMVDSNTIIVLIGVSERVKKQLPHNIIGISRTNSVKELAEWYTVADIFLNPTWEDNFPTTNLEALACGTPIITYRTGGSVEAVSSETGLVVDKGNIEALYQAVQQISSKGKSHYSESCRSRAEANYNKHDRFKDYIDIYKSVKF